MLMVCRTPTGHGAGAEFCQHYVAHGNFEEPTALRGPAGLVDPTSGCVAYIEIKAGVSDAPGVPPDLGA